MQKNTKTNSNTTVVINDPELQRIVRLLHAGKIKECLREIDLFLILDKNNSDAFYIKACCQNATKEYDNSLLTLDQAIKIKNLYAYNLQKIAVLRELKKYKKSLDICDNLISREPQNSRAYLEKSITYAYMDELTKEVYWAKKALEIEKIDSTYARLLVAYSRNRQYVETLALEPHVENHNKETLNALATASGNLGNKEKAIHYLEKAITLDSQDPILKLNYALSWQRCDQAAKSIDILKDLLDRHPQFEQAWINLAVSYISIGYNEQAINCAEKILTFNKMSWAAYNIIANGHMQTLNCDIAKESLLKSIEINPNQPRAYVDLGSCYEFLNDFNNMKIAWNKVPRDVAVQSNLPTRLELYDHLADESRNIYMVDNFAKYAKETEAKTHDYIKILEFHDTHIMQDDWFVFSKGKLYSDLCWQSKMVSTIVANSELGNVKTLDSPVVSHPRELFYVGGANNYYHWILDYLPRLQVLKENPEYQEMDCLVYSDWTNFQQQTLDLLGLDLKKVAYHGSHKIHSSKIIVPMTISRPLMRNMLPDNWVPRIHSKSLAWLERAFVHERNVEQKLEKRIYVSRKNAPHRRLLNEQLLIEKLIPLGFEIVSLENVSLDRQIDLFAKASIVVSAHGAAFANTAWSCSGSTIIELHGGQVPEFFKNIAGLKNINWAEVEGTNVTSNNPNKKFLDFVVNPDLVIEKIKNYL